MRGKNSSAGGWRLSGPRGVSDSSRVSVPHLDFTPRESRPDATGLDIRSLNERWQKGIVQGPDRKIKIGKLASFDMRLKENTAFQLEDFKFYLVEVTPEYHDYLRRRARHPAEKANLNEIEIGDWLVYWDGAIVFPENCRPSLAKGSVVSADVKKIVWEKDREELTVASIPHLGPLSLKWVHVLFGWGDIKIHDGGVDFPAPVGSTLTPDFDYQNFTRIPKATIAASGVSLAHAPHVSQFSSRFGEYRRAAFATLDLSGSAGMIPTLKQIIDTQKRSGVPELTAIQQASSLLSVAPIQSTSNPPSLMRQLFNGLLPLFGTLSGTLTMKVDFADHVTLKKADQSVDVGPLLLGLTLPFTTSRVGTSGLRLNTADLVDKARSADSSPVLTLDWDQPIELRVRGGANHRHRYDLTLAPHNRPGAAKMANGSSLPPLRTDLFGLSVWVPSVIDSAQPIEFYACAGFQSISVGLNKGDITLKDLAATSNPAAISEGRFIIGPSTIEIPGHSPTPPILPFAFYASYERSPTTQSGTLLISDRMRGHLKFVDDPRNIQLRAANNFSTEFSVKGALDFDIQSMPENKVSIRAGGSLVSTAPATVPSPDFRQRFILAAGSKLTLMAGDDPGGMATMMLKKDHASLFELVKSFAVDTQKKDNNFDIHLTAPIDGGTLSLDNGKPRPTVVSFAGGASNLKLHFTSKRFASSTAPHRPRGDNAFELSLAPETVRINLPAIDNQTKQPVSISVDTRQPNHQAVLELSIADIQMNGQRSALLYLRPLTVALRLQYDHRAVPHAEHELPIVDTFFDATLPIQLELHRGKQPTLIIPKNESIRIKKSGIAVDNTTLDRVPLVDQVPGAPIVKVNDLRMVVESADLELLEPVRIPLEQLLSVNPVQVITKALSEAELRARGK